MNWMPVSYILSIYEDVYYPCILKQNHYLNDLVRSDQRANSYCKPNQVHIKIRTNFLYDIYKYILCFCSCAVVVVEDLLGGGGGGGGGGGYTSKVTMMKKVGDIKKIKWTLMKKQGVR